MAGLGGGGGEMALFVFIFSAAARGVFSLIVDAIKRLEFPQVVGWEGVCKAR